MKNILKENEELFYKVFKHISEREKQILIELNEIYDPYIYKILKDGINRINKSKPLKKNKEILKLATKIKKLSKYAFESIEPKPETLMFHQLLYCNIALCAEVCIDSKLLKMVADKKGVPVKRVEDELKLEVKFYNYSEDIKKEIKLLDGRVSNLLIKLIDYNDNIINVKNVQKILNKSKESITITNTNKKVEDTDSYERIKDIMKMVAVGRTSIEEFEFKYDKKSISNIKYIHTRSFNLIRKMETELHLGKYKELVVKSFIKEGEPLTEKAVDSYLDYLYWLDDKGQLESEYELIKDVA